MLLRGAGLALVVAAFLVPALLWPLAGLGLTAFLLLDHLHPQSRILYRPRVRGSRSGKEVALTFDDGPNGETTRRLLAELKRLNVKATFFVVGRHAEREPDLVRRIRDEGHAIGNHTQQHRKLWLLGPRRVRHEVEGAQHTLTSILGYAPRLFRAPHGFRSPFLPRVLRRARLEHWAWTRGVWDSERGANARVVAARATRAPRPGDVLLLHDGDGVRAGAKRDATIAALPEIVKRYREGGYKFVTLDAWRRA